jgi:hypothetical protein
MYIHTHFHMYIYIDFAGFGSQIYREMVLFASKQAIYLYIHKYTYLHTHMYICLYMCIYVRTYTFLHIRKVWITNISRNGIICIKTSYLSVYIDVYQYICMYTFTLMLIFTCMHVYTYTFSYVYISILQVLDHKYVERWCCLHQNKLSIYHNLFI